MGTEGKGEGLVDLAKRFAEAATNGGYASAVLVNSLGGMLGAVLKLTPPLKFLGESYDFIIEKQLKFIGVTQQEQAILAIASGKIKESLTTLVDTALQSQETLQAINVEMLKFGQDSKFLGQIQKQAFETAKLGISFTNLREANKELISSYNDSIRITGKQSDEFDRKRGAMAELIAFNHKFGISSKDTTTILNASNDVFGEGTARARLFSEQIEKFSMKTGQQASNVFKELSDNIDRFSFSSGEKAAQTFMRLEMLAKRTGVSTSDVINNIKRFDDIETGFQAGGQLNRVLSFLGGSFDTFKVIQADDKDRAEMIYGAISGVSNRFQALQTEGAKRNFAEEISESSRVDLKTVIGLLSKSTNLADDIKDIQRVGLPTTGFGNQEREEIAQKLTTSTEFGKLRDEFFLLSSATTKLATVSQNMAAKFTERSVGEFKFVEKNFITPALAAVTTQLRKLGLDTKKGELDKIFQERLSTVKDLKVPVGALTEAVNLLTTERKTPVKVDTTNTIILKNERGVTMATVLASTPLVDGTRG